MAVTYDVEGFSTDANELAEDMCVMKARIERLYQRSIDCGFQTVINALATDTTQWDSTIFDKITALQFLSAMSSLLAYWNGQAVATSAYGEKWERVAQAIPAA